MLFEISLSVYATFEMKVIIIDRFDVSNQFAARACRPLDFV